MVCRLNVRFSIWYHCSIVRCIHVQFYINSMVILSFWRKISLSEIMLTETSKRSRTQPDCVEGVRNVAGGYTHMRAFLLKSSTPGNNITAGQNAIIFIFMIMYLFFYPALQVAVSSIHHHIIFFDWGHKLILWINAHVFQPRRRHYIVV